MKINIFTLSQESMVNSGGSSSIVESKIPLWWADGTSAQSGTHTTSGNEFLLDGSSNVGSVYNASNAKLYTHNVSWQSSQQISLEVCLSASSINTTIYVALWDITSNLIVSTSQLSTTVTSAILVRSGRFTLIAGHTYGVTIWQSASNTGSAVIQDASLIVFG